MFELISGFLIMCLQRQLVLLFQQTSQVCSEMHAVPKKKISWIKWCLVNGIFVFLSISQRAFKFFLKNYFLVMKFNSNRRISGVGRGLWRSSHPTPCWRRVNWSRFRIRSSWVCIISKDEQRSLFQVSCSSDQSPFRKVSYVEMIFAVFWTLLNLKAPAFLY